MRGIERTRSETFISEVYVGLWASLVPPSLVLAHPDLHRFDQNVRIRAGSFMTTCYEANAMRGGGQNS